MNQYDSSVFEKLILYVTKEKDVNKGIYSLVRKGCLDREIYCGNCFRRMADSMLYSLNHIDFNKEVYDRISIADFLISKFYSKRNLNDFLKPLRQEIKNIIDNIVYKTKNIIEKQFTKTEIKNIFIDRVILVYNTYDYAFYCDRLKIEYPESNFKRTAYSEIIYNYNCEFNIKKANLDKRLELINERYNYKINQIIISLREKKYSKKDIIKYLNITESLYDALKKKYNITEKNKNLNKSTRISICVNKNKLECLDLDVKELDNISKVEGKKKIYVHNKIERNNTISKLAKRSFKYKYGRLFCECCGFDFYEKYGELGEDYIEAHHANALAEIECEVKTLIRDFKMVCANCHRMLHRRYPCLKIEELKNTISSNQEE